MEVFLAKGGTGAVGMVGVRESGRKYRGLIRPLRVKWSIQFFDITAPLG